MRILSVENNPDDAEFYRRDLVKYRTDIEVINVKTLREATQMMERMPPRVILLDLNLDDSAGEEGFRTLYRMSRRMPDPQPPIIILSGAYSLDMADHLMKQGAFDYIDKNLITLAKSPLWLAVKKALRAQGEVI